MTVEVPASAWAPIHADSSRSQGQRSSSVSGVPDSLLPSQLATLEPLEPDEPGVVVSVDEDAAQVVARAVTALGLDRHGREPPEVTTLRE